MCNPLEGSSYDLRHTEIAIITVKRGHSGEGKGPNEVDVENIGVIAVLRDREQRASAELIDRNAGSDNPATE